MRPNRPLAEAEEYALTFPDFKEIAFDMKSFCKSCSKPRTLFATVKGEACWFVPISHFKKST